jgi:multicomponent K+:H+ antiporter subunit E
MLLALLWLLMQQSLAPAHLLSAVVLALLVPRLVHGFLGPASRVHSVSAAMRLCAVVLWDIVVSNLDTRDPMAVTLFASIITMTPGTVSCVVDDERWQILVHALDCDDPQAMAAQMKQRYEQPLRQIFEGEGP